MTKIKIVVLKAWSIYTEILEERTINMNLEVELFYDLVKYLPPGSKNRKCSISMEDGSTIQELVNKLGLPSEMPKIILVNGIRPQNGIKLHEGDVIAIFPPIAGG